GTNLVVDEIDVVARARAKTVSGPRVPGHRVPLAVDQGVGHAAIAAEKARAVVLGSSGAEVGEGQIVEVEVAARIDRELGVAAARAHVRLALLGRARDDPFEGLARVLRVPDPAGVGGKRAGNAGVDPARIGWVEPDIVLESNALDAADRRLSEGGRLSTDRNRDEQQQTSWQQLESFLH